MAKLTIQRKLEMGRRVATKELTAEQAAAEYGCHKSMAFSARRLWLSQQPTAVAEVKTVPDQLVAKLEAENERLHDEVRTLQKLLMTVGRAL